VGTKTTKRKKKIRQRTIATTIKMLHLKYVYVILTSVEGFIQAAAAPTKAAHRFLLLLLFSFPVAF
jgi:hypothetical protein